MSAINLNTSRTDTTTHRAIIGADELKRIVIEHVAAAAGVDPGAQHVRVSCNLSSRMGNYGSIDEAIVSITVDHEKQARAPEVES
ncbi:hypothetical protein LJR034_004678 [Caballeronia sp. LjRoot34]|uniref:hypothetical protein n=1 Tax=Caballeronia sp. LjRoot34 TaxID=3342325 RepID=UPI003ECF4244